MGLEELEGFVKLVKKKNSFVVLSLDGLDVCFDVDQSLNIGKIFVLDSGSTLSLFDEGHHLLDLLLSVLDHGWTSEVVVLGISCGIEGGSIW